MSINVSHLNNSDGVVKKAKDNDTVKKNAEEITLFSNQKVATDINKISAKYNSADFDDEREFAELKNYISKFKNYLSNSVQNFLNNIANKTTTYTAEQIQEMASHTDKATADRAAEFAQAFSSVEDGTINILAALAETSEVEKTPSYTAEQIQEMASHTDKATADRAAKSAQEFSDIEPGTLEILGLILG